MRNKDKILIMLCIATFLVAGFGIPLSLFFINHVTLKYNGIKTTAIIKEKYSVDIGTQGDGTDYLLVSEYKISNLPFTNKYAYDEDFYNKKKIGDTIIMYVSKNDVYNSINGDTYMHDIIGSLVIIIVIVSFFIFSLYKYLKAK